MARTEPAPEITRLADRHAPQMSTHTHHDEPLGLLDTVGVGLRVTQRLDFDGFGFLNLRGGAVADEDGFAAPFDEDLLGRKEGGKVRYDC